MRFDKIQRHIYCIVSKDIPSDWFYINTSDQFTFKKGLFKGRTAEEVYERYRDNDNESNYWQYLQYIYDEQANWKDKRNIYDIHRQLKNKTTK